MAITDLQREICRLIADRRVEHGETYVAGGVALNELIGARRQSRDVDLFHDTREALTAAWDADRECLTRHGYALQVTRERPTFVEAVVRRGAGSVALQWVCDSAFRFFPLVRHPDLGATLHPFDLATNKLLALVGRHEARDWVDAIACAEGLQPLGYLAWAASGKDPGFGPALLLEEARRSGRYRQEEIAALAFDGATPDAAELSARWRAMLDAAEATLDALPLDQVGRCVLGPDGELFRGDAQDAAAALARGGLRFHTGRIRGAWPEAV